MKKTLALLVLLAPLLLAESPAPLVQSAAPPKRSTYPSDYKPHSCAPQDICASYNRSQFAMYAATFRGYDLEQEWVEAHWDEMVRSLQPLCDKVGTCQATARNEWTFCKDIMRNEFVNSCGRYPEGSRDHIQCKQFALMFYLGQDMYSRTTHEAAQKCAAERAQPGERTMEIWMEPATIPHDYEGIVRFYALDSETRVPVMAYVVSDGPHRMKAKEAPAGEPVTYYPITFRMGMKRVPRADGHRDVILPVITFTAPGYRTEHLTIPADDTATMVITMSPQKLRHGRNTVTITAKDSLTGAPLEARVMGNDRVLGKTNTPFELEWKRGQELPEIWVTSLYDRYDDVVVVKAQK